MGELFWGYRTSGCNAVGVVWHTTSVDRLPVLTATRLDPKPGCPQRVGYPWLRVQPWASGCNAVGVLCGTLQAWIGCLSLPQRFKTGCPQRRLPGALGVQPSASGYKAVGVSGTLQAWIDFCLFLNSVTSKPRVAGARATWRPHSALGRAWHGDKWISACPYRNAVISQAKSCPTTRATLGTRNNGRPTATRCINSNLRSASWEYTQKTPSRACVLDASTIRTVRRQACQPASRFTGIEPEWHPGPENKDVEGPVSRSEDPSPCAGSIQISEKPLPLVFIPEDNPSRVAAENRPQRNKDMIRR